MSNLRQAAQQALEALENLCRSLSPESVLATSLNHRITALRAALAEEAMQRLTDVSQEIEAALAEPEQEPFCYHDGRNIVGKEYADHSDVFPLYTAPPQRKPLTDEEIEREWASAPSVIDFTRAIEAAHGIKGEA